MTALLDASVLIALSYPLHQHHDAANRWMELGNGFAVCPMTEGALIRFILRIEPGNTLLVQTTLRLLESTPGYEFWSDDLRSRD